MSGNKDQAKEYSSFRLRKYFHSEEKALTQKKDQRSVLLS